MNDLLTAQRLSCERGGLNLFHDLDFSICAGELVQIVGPNGCGKTTLLRLLAGLGVPTAGQVIRCAEHFLYHGHRLGLKARLSPLENLRWYFPDASEEKICRALQAWQLGGYEHIRCERLSAGQQQRVALSRLTLSEAQLYLLDEPFTAIDRLGVEQLEQCLLEKTKQGVGVIFTSHHHFSQAAAVRTLNVQDYLL